MDPAQLADTPAGIPPPGVIPNFVNPHRNSPILIAVGSVSVALMVCFVAVRIYTKAVIARKYSPDDYTCLIAATGTILYFVIDVLAVTIGHFGTHIWDLTLSDVASNDFLILSFFTNWTFFFFIPFAKMTFFLLYIQLFFPMRWLRYSSYAGATFTALFYTAIVVWTLAVTSPAPGESWQMAAPKGIKTLRDTVWIASVGLALDVYILLLPIAGVSRLQMSRSRKLGVMMVFSTGLIACIASSLAVYYKWKLQRNDPDVTYHVVPNLLTGLVELSVGVSASSMPAMSNMLRHLPAWANWDFITSKISLRFSGRSDSGHSKYADSGQSNSKPQRANYADLGKGVDGPGPRDYEMGPIRSTRTYVRTGKSTEVDEDGIHLKYDVEQQSLKE